jgi:hypothetical protein
MNFYYQITATVFTVAFLFSCNQKKIEKNKANIISSIPLSKKEVEVIFIGEIRTRRSFADIQFIKNEKEKDRYVAEQEKSNPWVCEFFPKDSMLVKQFQKLGLIKKDEYLEKRFKPQTKKITVFMDSAKKNFPLIFFNDSLTGHTHFKIFFSNDSIDVNTQAFSPQNLDYAFLDVIPGGNKELVFLDDYYVMNGYNFDFKIYEIKTK